MSAPIRYRICFALVVNGSQHMIWSTVEIDFGRDGFLEVIERAIGEIQKEHDVPLALVDFAFPSFDRPGQTVGFNPVIRIEPVAPNKKEFFKQDFANHPEGTV